MQNVSFDPMTGRETPLPENLDDFIVHHPHREQFTDTPAFVVLYFAVVAVIGSFVGVLLGLRT